MEIPAEIVGFLTAATGEVFETMAFGAIEPAGAGSRSWIGPHVVASVALTGHRRGLVTFYSSVATAQRIAGAMLDMPADSINGELPDAIGEVANMIAGTFRNKLAAVEPLSDIAPPTVTVGSDFSTHSASHARRAVRHFTMDGETIGVELTLTSH